MSRWIGIMLLLAATGCAAEEALDPAPSPSTGGTAGGPPDPGPKVREVFVRNPIGSPAQNLLADGDFELSIVPEGSDGQYGWIAFGSGDGAEPILGETGGICRSGLRCGRVPGGTVLFGRGAAAPDKQAHRASILLKAQEPFEPTPGGSACDLADVYVLVCDTFDVKEELEPAAAPTEDGWCEYSDAVLGSPLGLCMYVEVGSVAVLVDNATLVVAPDVSLKPPPAITLAPQRNDRMMRIRERVRARLPLDGRAIPVDPRIRARREHGE